MIASPCATRRNTTLNGPTAAKVSPIGAACGAILLALLMASVGCADLGGSAADADLDADAADAGGAADAAPTAPMPGAVTVLTSPRGPGVVRFASYNIEKNSAFELGSPQGIRFARLAKTIQADVWALQEVWSSPATIAAWFDQHLPLPDGATWTAVDGGSTMTVTRFPVLQHRGATAPDSGRKVSLTWIDVPTSLWDQDIYFINVHMTCCGDGELSRQRQADSIAAWVQRLHGPQPPVALPPGTPLLLMGDLNLVGGTGPLHTLVTGDINDEATWGKDAPPDWDSTALQDIRPHHNGDGEATWTWRWDGSGFKRRRLDCALLSDSVAQVVDAMVLNTTIMTQAQLDALGLARLDVGKAKYGDGWVLDHLPLVVDVKLRGP